MKKGNIADTVSHTSNGELQEPTLFTPISSELENAIESLITQLRDIGPLEKKSG